MRQANNERADGSRVEHPVRRDGSREGRPIDEGFTELVAHSTAELVGQPEAARLMDATAIACSSGGASVVGEGLGPCAATSQR